MCERLIASAGDPFWFPSVMFKAYDLSWQILKFYKNKRNNSLSPLISQTIFISTKHILPVVYGFQSHAIFSCTVPSLYCSSLLCKSLYILGYSFSADPFSFLFVDYDSNTKSNEGNLEYFDSKRHWTNRTPSSSDWIIRHPRYSKKYD